MNNFMTAMRKKIKNKGTKPPQQFKPPMIQMPMMLKKPGMNWNG